MVLLFKIKIHFPLQLVIISYNKHVITFYTSHIDSNYNLMQDNMTASLFFTLMYNSS